MNINLPHKIRGATLVDALIAMVVASVGLLALAFYQTDIMSTSSESRTRIEAANLAQRKIEQLRDLAVEDDFIKILNGSYVTPDVLADESITVPGINTEFTVASDISGLSGTVTSTDEKFQTVSVVVSWLNSDGDTENVTLASLIAWDNPTSAAARGQVTSIDQLLTAGTHAPIPAGGGSMAEDGDDLSGKTLVNDNQDGTKTYVDSDGVYYIAADRTGDAEGFIPIFVSTEPLMVLSGEVSTIDDTSLDIVRILTSDAGFCIYREGTGLYYGSDGAYYGSASGGTLEANAFNCYVAADWFGNLGALNNLGADFCSAAIRYQDNCDVTQNVSFVPVTGVNVSGCPYTGAPQNGLIGELPDQDFLLTAGGCFTDASGQASITGDISGMRSTKIQRVTYLISGEAIEQDCTLTLSGQSANGYICVVGVGDDVTITLYDDEGGDVCDFDVNLGGQEAQRTRHVSGTSCSEP